MESSSQSLPTGNRGGSALTSSSSDAQSEKSYEAAAQTDQDVITPHISRISIPSLAARKIDSVATTGTSDPNFEVDWEDENDPENPHNWSAAYKGMVIAFLSWNTLVVVLHSSSYTAALAAIAKEFEVSETLVTLGLTTYLLGLGFGSVLLAPLSEMYGRKPVAVTSLLMFLLFLIPSGVGSSLESIIVTRFFGALLGSAMIASAPGSVVDLVNDEHRALAFSIWSIGPLNGPVVGPIIGGFISQYLGWRWTGWITLIFAGFALVFSCISKETYAPVILRKKAARMRKEMDDPRWWSRYDQKKSIKEVMKVNLSRPFIMAVKEPICIFWNVYISIIYAILYLCFTAYPIIFRQIRGWSVGLSGLGFVGIGIGGLLTVACEPLIRKMINNHKVDPETGKVPPEAMVSAVCIAAVLIPVGEMWFAWTCAPASIHWVLPILAGIPFGAGNTGVFIYASNYLTYSYGVYAASAMAGNAVIRSILGGVFPLIGPHLYRRLGPNWSGTFLALLEVAIVPIPFVFYRYGHKIRMKSNLIQEMQEDKKRLEGKRSKAQNKQPSSGVKEVEEV